MTDIQIKGIDIDPETIQVVWNDEPRISEGGQPVAHSHILTISRGDEPTAPIVEDLITTLTDYVTDLIVATSPSQTKSLDEYEMSLEDDELDLGMGDSRDEVSD